MNKTRIRSILTAAIVSLASGCSATGGPAPAEIVKVRQITQSAHCSLTGPGVALVASGAERENLLDVRGQNMATDKVREVDLAREILVIVTLGQKPTAGYSIGLAEAQTQDQNLVLDMQVREPAPDMMVAQVITSPCVVLAVEPGDWQELRVRGVTEPALVHRFEN